MNSEADAGERTRREIHSQPEIWESTLNDVLSKSTDSLPELALYDYILFAGCGSTFYLSQWAARECQKVTGIHAIAMPASEIVLAPEAWLHAGSRGLLVAVSRSAETTETVRAIEAFVQRTEGDALAITCNPDGPVTQKARWVLAAPDAQETSVAQTRSFTSMMLLAAWLIDRGHARQAVGVLPTAAARLLDRSRELAEGLGGDLTLDKFFFLGSGPLFGLASEGMLKMKEMSLSQSEAYHFMEIRHGPMSIVDGGAVVLGLMGTSSRDYEIQVIEHMQRLGGRTVALDTMDEFPDGASEHVDIGGAELDPLWHAPLFLPFMQLLAFHRATAKGLNPDRPKHLDAVVFLDD